MGIQDYLVLGMGCCLCVVLLVVFRRSYKPISVKLGGSASNKFQPAILDNQVGSEDKVGRLVKTTKLVVEEENKSYFLMDMGNGKLIVFEEEDYVVDEVHKEMAESIVLEDELSDDENVYEPEDINQMEVFAQEVTVGLEDDSMYEESDLDLNIKEGIVDEDASMVQAVMTEAAEDWLSVAQGNIFEAASDMNLEEEKTYDDSEDDFGNAV